MARRDDFDANYEYHWAFSVVTAPRFRIALDRYARQRQDDPNSHRNKTIEDQLRRCVELHKFAKLRSGPYAAPRLAPGRLLLGYDSFGCELRTSPDALLHSTVIAGGTGSGKTTAQAALTTTLLPHLAGVWLIDLRKSNTLTKLKPLFALQGRELLLPKTKELRLNCLGFPPSVDRRAFLAQRSPALARALDMPPPTAREFTQLTYRLASEYGYLNSDSAASLTLLEIVEGAERMPDIHPDVRLAIQARLRPLLWSAPEIARYRCGWENSSIDLQRLCIGFQLADALPTVQAIYLLMLIENAFLQRDAMPAASLRPLLIAVDESSRLIELFSPVLASWLGVVRESRVLLSIATNQVDETSAQIFANAPIKLLGQAAGRDAQLMGQAMGLTWEQQQFIVTRLTSPGHFACQLANEWRHPFLMRFPNVFDQAHAPSSAGPVRLLPHTPHS